MIELGGGRIATLSMLSFPPSNGTQIAVADIAAPRSLLARAIRIPPFIIRSIHRAALDLEAKTLCLRAYDGLNASTIVGSTSCKKAAASGLFITAVALREKSIFPV